MNNNNYNNINFGRARVPYTLPSYPIRSRLCLKLGWVALTAKGNQLNPLTTLIRKGYYESVTLEPGGLGPVWGRLGGSNLNTANLLTFDHLLRLEGGIQTKLNLCTANLLNFSYLHICRIVGDTIGCQTPLISTTLFGCFQQTYFSFWKRPKRCLCFAGVKSEKRYKVYRFEYQRRALIWKLKIFALNARERESDREGEREMA